MARLHEHQGKSLLKQGGVPIPDGAPASSPRQASEIARRLGGPVVLKIQAWTTGRAALGGVAFANTPEEAAIHAERLLKIKVGNFAVTEVLVEARVNIAREFFFSLAIDDRMRAPVMLIATGGGTGIEDRASSVQRITCDAAAGPDAAALNAALKTFGLSASEQQSLDGACRAAFDVARANEARSLEINPLVITRDGSVVAADCRVTIDDYAVARHPELGIEIARELDHPPTMLERIAYGVEQADHRGTFFFAQMNTGETPATKAPAKLIGFHGAGGGGSMMSMDAVTNEGFTIANFCDTSGNPSPAKVYRAARIILSQPGIVGYFGSGSGVANQEQFWSAYGLAKAFWELELNIPTVIRLGGNTEDRAVEILESACKGLPARVEGYRKNDPPSKIARRLAELVAESERSGARGWTPRRPRKPDFVNSPDAIRFDLKGGRVWISPQAWAAHAPAIVARSNGLLRNDSGRPVPTLPPDQLAAKDSDFIACEVECRRDGIEGLFVELDVPGLDETLSARPAA